jgi:hypothetical protein
MQTMWYQPAALISDKRDVIGAWIVCLAVALVFFGYPAVTAMPDVWQHGCDTPRLQFDPLVDLFELIIVRYSNAARQCRSQTARF